ncbi:hypothetical protein CERZMDRAFT_91336 [Cercospora zeae-maydis SCOH1-5]|uniref:Uncharacterized protein n=1 Tax=Cercospora zeae-maydis SCOH1-5 TaxID=717836 RepID=A0A6A6F7Q4_9PEZI|nr:hypothetical protein CERZMDRAFT_91336 [Cercospora zeae-maydis SCOH1-5]
MHAVSGQAELRSPVFGPKCFAPPYSYTVLCVVMRGRQASKQAGNRATGGEAPMLPSIAVIGAVRA